MNSWKILCLCIPLFLHAGMDDKINEFFDRFNTVTHTNSPEYIQSQLGVHFLGGSGASKMHVYDVNPVHMSLPAFSAGCGGIDYALGGINIASKEEMKNALKSIASNGIGYAFLLGIETVSPVVASTMKQIQTWANQLNAMSINSCEIATSLVQGVWPKNQRASSYICEHAATTNSLFKDHIEARHGCRDDGSKRTEAIKKVRDDNRDVLVGSYNIAWKALEKVSVDEETKNLFMNLTGTIVVEEKKIAIYPPQFKQAVELLRFGGEIKNGYKIDREHIGIEIKPIEIKRENAWKQKVYRMLSSLQEKILNEKTGTVSSLSTDEKNLINTTWFPIGSLLTLMTQYNGKGGMVALDRYSDLIALERVLKFAEEVVREILYRAEFLRAVQVNGYDLDEYIKQVTGVLRDLQAMSSENLQKISVEHQVIDYLIKLDRNVREKERGL